MSEREPPLPLDAIVRVLAELAPESGEAERAFAAALRIGAPGSAAPEARSAPAPVASTLPAGKRGEARQRDRGQRRHPPRVIRLFELPRVEPRGTRAEAKPGKILPLERSRDKGLAAPHAQCLTPAATSRGIIKALLSTTVADGEPDYRIVLRRLTEGRPVERLPLKAAASLARGATLLIDVGPWLDPFRADAAELVDMLRSVVGRERLTIYEALNGPPILDEGGHSGAEPSFRPLPHAPVLILSDFGLSRGKGLPAQADPTTWSHFADVIGARGNEPIGLLPFAPDTWPSSLRRAMALVHWTAEATARSIRRARERSGGGVWQQQGTGSASAGDVERLTNAASVASSVEPRLLRDLRLRLFPKSSPALEASFWWGGDIGSRGVAAVTLSAEALTRGRAVLREAPLLASTALDCLHRSGAPASPVLRLADEIVELDILRPDRWEQRIAAKLNDLVHSLLDHADQPRKEALDASRYVLAAIAPLAVPPAGRRVKTDLLFLASRLLGAAPDARSQRGGASRWLVHRLAAGDVARHPIGIQWGYEGLKLTPGGTDNDRIEVAGAPPIVSAVWSPPRNASPWLGLERARRLTIPNVDYFELRSLDGTRWGVEDADAADSLPPLRVFALVHPADRDGRTERFLDLVETALRIYSGHPEAAPLLVRQLGTSWADVPTESERLPLRGSGIGTWRSAAATAAAEATAFIVIVTPALLNEDSSEALVRIARASSPRSSIRAPAIALDWSGDTRAADQLLERHALNHVEIRRRRAGDSSEADAIARRLSRAWRRQQSGSSELKPPAAVDAGEPSWIISALQGLSLAFHVHSFSPDVGSWWGEELDAALWGLRAAPSLPSSSGGDPTALARRAEADLRFVVFLAEYVYSGPVMDYLAGFDPFRPVLSAEDMAAVWEGRDKLGSSHGPRLPSFEPCMMSFQRFGAAADVQRLQSIVGSMTELREVRRIVGGDRLLEVAHLLHPHFTAWDELRGRHEFSFARSRTFPEFMESFSGLLLHYVRALARNRPDTKVRLSYPSWFEASSAVRMRYPALSDDRKMSAGFVLSESSDAEDLMPIAEFADLFQSLSGLLAFHLRSRADEYRVLTRAAKIAEGKMAKTKVFVSYDHSEDTNYKRLLQAWDANDSFDFEFDSRGPEVAINSSDAATIKAALTTKMKSATHLLVLVGAKSHESKWMAWEIDRAKQDDIKLKLAAIKLAKLNTTPPGLLNVGTSWATSFERDRIVEALKLARIGY